MNMKLSELETDLLGDLAQSPMLIWEFYQYCRLHYQGESEPIISDKVATIVKKWAVEGWIYGHISVDGTERDIAADGLVELLSLLGDTASSPTPNALEISLTSKAYEDVKWLHGTPAYRKRR